MLSFEEFKEKYQTKYGMSDIEVRNCYDLLYLDDPMQFHQDQIQDFLENLDKLRD